MIESDVIVVGKGGYIDTYAHNGRHRWQQELQGRGLGRIALAFPGNIAQADDTGGG